MPYFSIETNQTIDETSNRDLMTKTSAFIAELLGKPESYVMISLPPESVSRNSGKQSARWLSSVALTAGGTGLLPGKASLPVVVMNFPVCA